jgi:peptide/nickel transport system substrate-binding protein
MEFPTGILAQDYEPPHDKPGPATDTIHFKSFHVDLAGASLQAGDMDLYLFSLKTEAARKLKSNLDLKIYEAPATMISLILNPAPAPKGKLNPFSIREVRFALQYAVNRRFIAQEIYKGLAKTMSVQVGIFDFDYLTVYEQVKELDIDYDPEFAKQLVTEAMTKAGAKLVDNKWHFNNKPIRLKFIIRIEDERREIGDLIKAELDNMGFTTAPAYHSFAAAIRSVYSSDPQQFEWHLYTEGWGRGSAERYDYGTINSMSAPWLGNMPGWQEVGYWQYENDRLDQIGQRLFKGDFASVQERNEIYREMTKLSLDESVRIWLVTVVNSLPAKQGIHGITEDIASGPKSIWTLREAYIPNKDILTVGNLWVWTERSAWNPVGGFGDVYSNDIWQNIFDPPIWRDPFTGIPKPFRTTYDVETKGPSGALTIPPDAFLWDSKSNKFNIVAHGTTATSKVTYDYSKFFTSKWHHGQPITMADILYSISQTFDMVYNKDKASIEFANSVTSKPLLDTIRGFRIIGENKLEVYVDYWHFLDDYIAEYASIPSLTTPWEIRSAMDKLVFQERRAAYSDTAAQRFTIPWLSLVMDNDVRLLKRELLKMAEENWVPTNTFTLGDTLLVSKEEAQDRYKASLEWIKSYGMGVISNGPYKLTKFDPAAQFAELQAFRDPSYPFKPGDWFKGASPIIRFGTIETSGTGVGYPIKITLNVTGPGELELRYILIDPATGKKIASGKAKKVSKGNYHIQIESTATTSMRTGIYDLFLTASSNQVSTLAEKKVTLEATKDGILSSGATSIKSSSAMPKVTATPQPIPNTRNSRGCSGPTR